MSCNCGSTDAITSWIDLQRTSPKTILDYVSNAYMVMGGNTDQGSFLYSSTFNTPAGAWNASPFAYTGNPVVTALETDNLGMVGLAAQQNFSHQTWNNSAALAIPTRRLIFLKVGQQWQNNIPMNLGVGNYSDLQLSFLDNAMTAGDYKNTIQTISFTARAYTGAVSLNLTINQPGRVHLGLRGIDGGGLYSMFELEIIGF